MVWFAKIHTKTTAASASRDNTVASVASAPMHPAPVMLSSSDTDDLIELLDKIVAGNLRPEDIRPFFDARKSRSLLEVPSPDPIRDLKHWISQDGATEVFTNNAHGFDAYGESKTSLLIARPNFTGILWIDHDTNPGQLEYAFASVDTNNDETLTYGVLRGSLEKNVVDIISEKKIGDALGYYLGIDFPTDHAAALKLANEVRLGSHVNPYFRSVAIRLADVISREASQFNSSAERKGELSEVARAVNDLGRSQITFAELGNRILKTGFSSTEFLVARLWALQHFELYSGSKAPQQGPHYEQNRRDGQLFMRFAIGQMLGVTPEQLVQATFDFGPFYNRKNDKGFPIPGAYAADTPSLHDAMPTEGYGRFLGFKTTASGEIDFRFESPNNGMALITQEDIDVALALAFVGTKPIKPSFSLDEASKYPYFVSQKQWEPEWVGYSAFGKTLYATDYWLGAICVYNTGFAGKDDIDSRFTSTARELFDQMRPLDGNVNLQLRPMEIQRSWTAGERNEHECVIQKITMGITSERWEPKPDGCSDWSGKESGHSKIFNAHYEDIATMWPIYERQRQLMGLLYGLSELRSRGFEPSPSLMTRIKGVQEAYTSQPSLPLSNQFVLWHEFRR